MKDEHGIPTLYFSQMMYTDKELRLKSRPYINPNRVCLKNAIVESSVNGNLIFLNSEAANLVLRHIPSNFKMHDWWFYLCVSAFGKIIFDDRVTLLYRQHENNVIGAKTAVLGTFGKRLKRFLNNNKTYPIYSQASEFLDLYRDELPDGSRKILQGLIDSKMSLKARLKYSVKKNTFTRMKNIDNLFLRMLIVFNLY